MKNVFDYCERSGLFGTESDVPPRDLEKREALDSEWPELGWQSEWGESAWESEAKGNSRDFIRWVQSSLNKVLGIRLTVDGVMGSAIRSAIRSFQKSRGLTVDVVRVRS